MNQSCDQSITCQWINDQSMISRSIDRLLAQSLFDWLIRYIEFPVGTRDQEHHEVFDKYNSCLDSSSNLGQIVWLLEAGVTDFH